MKTAVLSFTFNGGKLNNRVKYILQEKGFEVEGFTLEKFSEDFNLNIFKPSLKEWIGENFNKYNSFIFIGAAGIAVRTIAPFIKSKDIDPAIIVIDEGGNFVIPILSGHIGGANELAENIAKKLKSTAVVTTATDINKKFAVDNFAVRNNLLIDDIKMIKVISSRILENKSVGIYSDISIRGSLPQYITRTEEEAGICISYRDIKPFKVTMNLIPKCLTLGIGCRKNKSLEDIENLVFSVLKDNEINFRSVKGIYSIDLKKHEKALIDFAAKYKLPFKVFSNVELNMAKGNFTKSAFVSSVTGVDNVCERSAVLGCKDGNGTIYIKKTSAEGVTVSLAKEEWSVLFE